jgi:hypothetical protein
MFKKKLPQWSMLPAEVEVTHFYGTDSQLDPFPIPSMDSQPYPFPIPSMDSQLYPFPIPSTDSLLVFILQKGPGHCSSGINRSRFIPCYVSLSLSTLFVFNMSDI